MSTTSQGWTIVSAPTVPTAPRSIEVASQDVVGISVNPFTGQQQVQDWNASWFELSISMPPMPKSVGDSWISFLVSLRGQACVFQFPSSWSPFLPSGHSSSYWRLKSNTAKWSISKGQIVEAQFEVREAF